jgi:hypothetical protein
MATLAEPIERRSTTAPERFGDARGSAPVRRRAAILYALLCLAGLLPSILNASAALQAFGLGIVFPGSGFYAVGGWALLAVPLVIVLMLAACMLWQLVANMALPILIWLVAAGLSALLVGTQPTTWGAYATAATTIGFLAFCTIIAKRHLAAEAERRDARAAYLPGALAAVEARAASIAAPGTREIAADEMAMLRFCLDRGLQPVEALDGFDVIEQFQTSGLRYQINNLLWALQVAQCHYTPNFHGYLSQAQRNLIDKLTVPKVWRWWRWENLWGNFSLNPDPIARDNIMFGGFSSTYVALYTATTGDDRYLKAGSLSFRWNGRKTFAHDLNTMLAVGRMNHRTATYGPLYPCEPNLTYSTCNIWGNFSHVVGDRLFGTDYAAKMMPTLKASHMSEMMGLDGSPHAGRVEPLGIRIPVYACNFVSASWGWMASAFFPDLSKRMWAVLREETVQFDLQGDVRLATLAYDRVDTGNYKKSEIGVYANMLILAREQGDEAVAEAIVRKLDRDFGRVDTDGVTSFANVSTTNNALVAMGRLVRRGDVRAMTLDGPPPSALVGPVLTGAAYPDVLVCKAFSNGEDLQLVLRAGDRPCEQPMVVERLQPGARYVVAPQGIEIVADAAGIARFRLFVDTRTVAHIRAD